MEAVDADALEDEEEVSPRQRSSKFDDPLPLEHFSALWKDLQLAEKMPETIFEMLRAGFERFGVGGGSSAGLDPLVLQALELLLSSDMDAAIDIIFTRRGRPVVEWSEFIGMFRNCVVLTAVVADFFVKSDWKFVKLDERDVDSEDSVEGVYPAGSGGGREGILSWKQ